eukprot:scaffold13594_cov95-Skeletonema_marinoi.AAC.1
MRKQDQQVLVKKRNSRRESKLVATNLLAMSLLFQVVGRGLSVLLMLGDEGQSCIMCTSKQYLPEELKTLIVQQREERKRH